MHLVGPVVEPSNPSTVEVFGIHIGQSARSLLVGDQPGFASGGTVGDYACVHLAQGAQFDGLGPNMCHQLGISRPQIRGEGGLLERKKICGEDSASREWLWRSIHLEDDARHTDTHSGKTLKIGEPVNSMMLEPVASKCGGIGLDQEG